MLQDLHSHTYYSYCGGDRPEEIIEAAIAGGIELFGINDHVNGVITHVPGWDALGKDGMGGWVYDRMLHRYHDHIGLLREKYAGRIKILQGIELCTLPYALPLPEYLDISYFDYALIEHIDMKESITGGDLFAYADSVKCRCGVAHTDLFAHAERLGIPAYDWFSRMAEKNIFWEMNVSYDSIHGYREHPYMLRFFDSPEEQEIIRRSGAEISIGFDGHRVKDYLPERVKDYCIRAEKAGIPLAFAER